MDVDELHERVLIRLDDADILEADESDKEADARRNRLFKAIRKRFRHLCAQTGQREDHEDDAGNQNDDEARMVALDDIAGDDLRQNERHEEERIEAHAAGLRKRHLRVERHQQRADHSRQNRRYIDRVPDLLKGRVRIRSVIEADDLVRVRDHDVSHRKECGQTGDDLGPDIRATLRNFEKFVQGCHSP